MSKCWLTDFKLDAFIHAPGFNPLPPPEQTAGFQRVVSRVVIEMQKPMIGNALANFGEKLLTSILHERNGIAVSYLQQHGLTIALPEPDVQVDCHQPSDSPCDPTVHQMVEGLGNLFGYWKSQGIPHERVMHVVNCLLVNPMENELDRLIQRFGRIKDEDRDSLAKSLALLVHAPDSPSIKEKVLRGLAGEGAFGYQSAVIRTDARVLLGSVDDREMRKFVKNRRNE